jgi:hypothetical protein
MSAQAMLLIIASSSLRIAPADLGWEQEVSHMHSLVVKYVFGVTMWNFCEFGYQ